MDDKSVEAVANATGALAKMTERVIEAGTKAGGFIGSLIAEPLRERAGIWTDNLRAQRAENFIDIQLRLRAKLAAAGPDLRLRQIPLSVGVPLLEAATIEEVPELREIWTNLLANFADSDSGVAAQKSFVTVLSELSSYEATILAKIYSLADDSNSLRGIVTAQLPDVVSVRPEATPGADLPPPAVQLALSNLSRLGLLALSGTYGGGVSTAIVHCTPFGRALVRACTFQSGSGAA